LDVVKETQECTERFAAPQAVCRRTTRT